MAARFKLHMLCLEDSGLLNTETPFGLLKNLNHASCSEHLDSEKLRLDDAAVAALTAAVQQLRCLPSAQLCKLCVKL